MRKTGLRVPLCVLRLGVALLSASALYAFLLLHLYTGHKLKVGPSIHTRPAASSLVPASPLARATADNSWISSVVWWYGSRSEGFSVENYRAFESLLSLLPDARHTLILAAPVAATFYKFGDLLSITHLLKYSKRGYNVGNAVMCKALTGVPQNFYFRTYVKPVCYTPMPNATHGYIMPPFHTNVFLALSQLSESGGVATDFSFMFRERFLRSSVRNGYCILESIGTHAPGGSTTWNWFANAVFVLKGHANPIISCVLKKFGQEDVMQCLKRHSATEGVPCVRGVLDQCFDEHSIINEIMCSDIPPNHSSDSNLLLQSFGGNALKATAHFMGDQSLDTDFAALWLGELGHSEGWIDFPESSVFRTLERTIRHSLDRWHPTQLDESCRHSCHPFSDEYHPNEYPRDVKLGQRSCAPFFFVPGFDAGFMKAASTFVFHIIAQHPQVLPPLKGSNFKETGCYLPPNHRKKGALGQRIRMFPFIEENESFVTGDGTVYYLHYEDVPKYILSDNPNTKSVIVVRHPVERMWSQYRFVYTSQYKNRGDPNLALQAQIAPGTMLHNLWKDAKNVADLHWRNFTRQRFDPFGALVVMSVYSIYVHRWSKLFGKENVLVLDSQDLEVKSSVKEEYSVKVRKTASRIFDFLGLCSHNVSITEKRHVTTNVKLQYSLSPELRTQLNEFFDPFNKRLSAMIERKLPW